LSFGYPRNRNALSLILAFLPFLIWAEASIGPIGMYRNFQEDLPSPLKSKERGFLYGVDAKYEVHLQDLWILATGRYLEGRTDYDGSLIDLDTSEVTPFASQTLNTLRTAEADFGFHLFGVTPFVGYGYHQWSREATDRKTGYDEFYQWMFLALGLNASWNPMERIRLGMVLKAMRTIDASVEITECFDTPLSLSLANRWNAEVQLPVQISFSDLITGSMEGFYRLERLGASKEAEIEGVMMHEPSSISQNFGFLTKLICSY